jgi:hypothetical protein
MALLTIPLTIFTSKYLIKQWSQPRLIEPNPEIPYDQLLNCAKLSAMAYNSPDQFSIPNAKFIERDHSQLYTWIQDEIRFIVFRGTEDLPDVKADVDVRMSVFDEGARVHRGFYKQFEAVALLLEAEINTNCHKIIFTGHSLGSSLASLGAFHFSFKFPEMHIECITFGSPRVGNHAFVTMFEERIKHHYRIYNYDDPIPMLPSIGNYHHISTNTLCFGEKGAYDFYNRDYYWVWRRVLDLSCVEWWHPIGAHHINSYIERLSAMIPPF